MHSSIESWSRVTEGSELIVGSMVICSSLAPHVTDVTSCSWQLVGLCWNGLQYTAYTNKLNKRWIWVILPETSNNSIISRLKTFNLLQESPVISRQLFYNSPNYCLPRQSKNIQRLWYSPNCHNLWLIKLQLLDFFLSWDSWSRNKIDQAWQCRL